MISNWRSEIMGKAICQKSILGIMEPFFLEKLAIVPPKLDHGWSVDWLAYESTKCTM
jgi:hypothetical protein